MIFELSILFHGLLFLCVCASLHLLIHVATRGTTRGRTYDGRKIGNINLHNYHETSLMNLNIKLSSAVSCPLIAILERSRDSGCGDRDRLLSDTI